MIKKHFNNPLLWIGFLILLFVPVLYTATSFYFQVEKLDQLETHIQHLSSKATQIKRQQEKENYISNQIKNADRFFIDKHLESLVFLEPEIKKLEVLDLDPNDPLKKRLQFLKGGSNRLLFTEEGIKRGEKIQEVEEKQTKSVEMNEEDVKKLLAIVEGHQIGPYNVSDQRPQLFFKQFQLTKKMFSPDEGVFEINTHMIKREAVK